MLLPFIPFDSVCIKCRRGMMSKATFVKKGSIILSTVPSDFLEVKCDHCGYFVWTETFDKVKIDDKAK